MLATANAGAKNFSEPLYFYRPFGDSSVISSSILKRGPTHPAALVCGWSWRKETQKHVL